MNELTYLVKISFYEPIDHIEDVNIIGERISIALENHKDHSENGFIGDSDNFTTNINVTPVVNDEATNLKQAILDVLELFDGNGVPNIDWIKNRLNEAII